MGVGVGITRWFVRAPLLLAALAVACKRSPSPPSPAPSAPGSVRLVASSAPPASASVAPMAPPSCADWTVNEHHAKGSLEHWCQLFGPCPKSLQEGVDRVPDFSTTVGIRGNYRTLRHGFLGGRTYTFEFDRLVGVETWNDLAFGPCAERQVSMYSAGLAVPSSEPGASCSVVPGRDYTSGEPCRCNLEVQTPTLVNGNRGPRLRTSLECLYEVGVAVYLCQRTLQRQRERMLQEEKNAKGHAERTECGDTVVTWPFQGALAQCRYDAAGALTGLRWGKRYESDGFAACPR